MASLLKYCLETRWNKFRSRELGTGLLSNLLFSFPRLLCEKGLCNRRSWSPSQLCLTLLPPLSRLQYAGQRLVGKGKSRVPSQLARKEEAELVRRPTIPPYVDSRPQKYCLETRWNKTWVICCSPFPSYCVRKVSATETQLITQSAVSQGEISLDPGNWYRVPGSICCFSFPGYCEKGLCNRRSWSPSQLCLTLPPPLSRLQYAGQRLVGKLSLGSPAS